jgi:hypothetical protein
MKNIAAPIMLLAALSLTSGAGLAADAQHKPSADAKSTNSLNAILRHGNGDIGYVFFHGGVIEGKDCTVRIDQHEYDEGGAQTQSLVKKTLMQACATAYQHGGGIPSGGFILRAINLADDTVFEDF